MYVTELDCIKTKVMSIPVGRLRNLNNIKSVLPCKVFPKNL
jgi:hypothetical protein